MGIIKKAFYTAFLGTAGVTGYVGLTTNIICPLPRDDPIWSSRSYNKYNRYHNPSTQDICFKRIPLDKIRPELLQKDGDLVVEFCRGVWSSWGYAIQRRYLARKYRSAETANQLWTVRDLQASTYALGTQITDHFEVVDKTATEITVRAGDSPRRPGPRDSDGLFVISAVIDRAAGEVELGLKSCFFSSAGRVEGIVGPMPAWMEHLHLWYSRFLMASGSRRVMR